MTVRRVTLAGPAMKSLTFCKAKRRSEESEQGYSWTCHEITHILSSPQDQIGSQDSEKVPSLACHEITHILSSQQDQVGVKTVRKEPAGSGMKSLTCCQANRIRVGVRTVRRDPAGPAMKSLTYCQANRTRVRVRTVRMDPAGPAMKSLTHCQANRTRVGVSMVSRGPTGPGIKLLTYQYHANPAIIVVRAHFLLSWTWKLNHLLPTILLYQTQGKCLPNLRWHPVHYFHFQAFLVKFVFHHIVFQCSAQYLKCQHHMIYNVNVTLLPFN